MGMGKGGVEVVVLRDGRLRVAGTFTGKRKGVAGRFDSLS